MIKEEKIAQLVQEKFSGSDKFLVSVKVHPGNRIVVYIDSDNSVNIDDCAELSRFIESQLDRDIEDFELEISSAGLTHPLVMKRQFIKNIGKEIKAVLRNGTVKKGILFKINESDFVLIEKIKVKENKKKQIIESEVSVPFNDAREVKLVINI